MNHINFALSESRTEGPTLALEDLTSDSALSLNSFSFLTRKKLEITAVAQRAIVGIKLGDGYGFALAV